MIRILTAKQERLSDTYNVMLEWSRNNSNHKEFVRVKMLLGQYYYGHAAKMNLFKLGFILGVITIADGEVSK